MNKKPAAKLSTGFTALALFGILAANLACKPRRPGSGNSGVKIVGGDPVGEGEFPQVLAIAVRADDDPKVYVPMCTATLVAEGLLVTAAHCLDIIPKTGDKPELSTYRVMAGNSWKAADKPRYFEIKSIEWHENFDRTKQYAADIGFVTFDQPADFKVEPAPLFTSSTCLQRYFTKVVAKEHDVITFVGFGHVSNIGTSAMGEKRVVKTRIAARNAAAAFDDYILVGESNRGTAKGDSGGPAFVLFDKKMYLFGITSSADFYGTVEGQQINTFSAETRVKLIPTYSDWLIKKSGTDIRKQAFTVCTKIIEDMPPP